MNLTMKAKSECALDVIAEVGPEIYWILLHFPEDFEPTDRWVSFKEELPGGIVRWLLWEHEPSGKWRRAA